MNSEAKAEWLYRIINNPQEDYDVQNAAYRKLISMKYTFKNNEEIQYIAASASVIMMQHQSPTAKMFTESQQKKYFESHPDEERVIVLYSSTLSLRHTKKDIEEIYKLLKRFPNNKQILKNYISALKDYRYEEDDDDDINDYLIERFHVLMNKYPDDIMVFEEYSNLIYNISLYIDEFDADQFSEELGELNEKFENTNHKIMMNYLYSLVNKSAREDAPMIEETVDKLKEYYLKFPNNVYVKERYIKGLFNLTRVLDPFEVTDVLDTLKKIGEDDNDYISYYIEAICMLLVHKSYEDIEESMEEIEELISTYEEGNDKYISALCDMMARSEDIYFDDFSDKIRKLLETDVDQIYLVEEYSRGLLKIISDEQYVMSQKMEYAMDELEYLYKNYGDDSHLLQYNYKEAIEIYENI